MTMTMTVAILWLGVAIEALTLAKVLQRNSYYSPEEFAYSTPKIDPIYADSCQAMEVPDNIMLIGPYGGPPGGGPPPGAPGGPPPGGPWGGSNGFGSYGGYWGGFGGYGYGMGPWGPNGLTPGGEQKGGKVAHPPKVKRSAWTRFCESLDRFFK